MPAPRSPLPCPHCDYDLSRTGHGDQVQCPECGKAVSRLEARRLVRGRELTTLHIVLWIGLVLMAMPALVMSGVAIHQEFGWLIVPVALVAFGALVFWLYRMKPRRHRDYLILVAVWIILSIFGSLFLLLSWGGMAAPVYNRVIPGW